jgi:integrase/recombinase XerD
VLLNARIQAELAVYLQTVRVRDPKQSLFATQRNAGFTANSRNAGSQVGGIYKKAGFVGVYQSQREVRYFITNLADKGVSTQETNEVGRP